MVLCAGCRMTACCGSDTGDMTGCLEYDEAMEEDDFVYYCRFCNETGKWSDFHVRLNVLPRRAPLGYL